MFSSSKVLIFFYEKRTLMHSFMKKEHQVVNAATRAFQPIGASPTTPNARTSIYVYSYVLPVVE